MSDTVYPLPGGAVFVLDEGEVGELLRSDEMTNLVRTAANALATELGHQGVDTVWVDNYQTDRAAAAVTIPNHTDSAELKTGLLADAATRIGLDVRVRGGI